MGQCRSQDVPCVRNECQYIATPAGPVVFCRTFDCHTGIGQGHPLDAQKVFPFPSYTAADEEDLPDSMIEDWPEESDRQTSPGVKSSETSPGVKKLSGVDVVQEPVPLSMNDLTAPMFFEEGKSVLDAEGHAQIERIANFLKNNPMRRTGFQALAYAAGGQECLSLPRLREVRTALQKAGVKNPISICDLGTAAGRRWRTRVVLAQVSIDSDFSMEIDGEFCADQVYKGEDLSSPAQAISAQPSTAQRNPTLDISPQLSPALPTTSSSFFPSPAQPYPSQLHPAQPSPDKVAAKILEAQPRPSQVNPAQPSPDKDAAKVLEAQPHLFQPSPDKIAAKILNARPAESSSPRAEGHSSIQSQSPSSHVDVQMHSEELAQLKRKLSIRRRGSQESLTRRLSQESLRKSQTSITQE